MSNSKIITENHDSRTQVAANPAPKSTHDSYEGRKHQEKIDGPQHDSQETDEIYSDPRKTEDLPAGGKNAAELNANDLSKDGNH